MKLSLRGEYAKSPDRSGAECGGGSVADPDNFGATKHPEKIPRADFERFADGGDTGEQAGFGGRVQAADGA